MIRKLFDRLRENSGLHPVNETWDAFVLDAVSRGDVERIDQYTAKVGGVSVWVENYPYAFGYPSQPEIGVLPKLSTRRALFQALVLATIKGAKA
jgi:hypothetical protein